MTCDCAGTKGIGMFCASAGDNQLIDAMTLKVAIIQNSRNVIISSARTLQTQHFRLTKSGYFGVCSD